MYLFLVSQLRVTGPKILAATLANRITTVTGCKSAAKFLTAVDRAAEGLHVFFIQLSMSRLIMGDQNRCRVPSCFL